jgi:menaquinone-9 beta-reductase
MNPSASHAADLFVIGGGPAGLAAAIAARQRGLNVVVGDGAEPPIDKVCGEGLLPDAVAALNRLGVHLPATESWAFRGIRFVTSELSAEAAFPQGRSGVAVRRTVLHRLLMEHAQQLGARFLWRTAVTGISQNSVHLGDRSVPARWIVGADGLHSRVRRWAGLDRSPRPRLRFAYRVHFEVAPWTDHMELYWGDVCQGYATAVNEKQVCIALASHDPKLRLREGLRDLPRLRERLQEAKVVSRERGALTGNRKLRRLCRGNVALIGDASGSVDAITGAGLRLAFEQATLLAECLESGNLARYQAEHCKLALRTRLMANLMLTLEGRPHLQARTVRVFRRRPEIFRRLLEFHMGGSTPLHLVGDGLSLGWDLLTA